MGNCVYNLVDRKEISRTFKKILHTFHIFLCTNPPTTSHLNVKNLSTDSILNFYIVTNGYFYPKHFWEMILGALHWKYVRSVNCPMILKNQSTDIKDKYSTYLRFLKINVEPLVEMGSLWESKTILIKVMSMSWADSIFLGRVWFRPF